jgi:hypothetical protein
MGRPAWVPTPEILEKAENLAAIGLTKEQIASCLGIGETTFYDKSIEYPEFAKAIKVGADKGIARVASLLIKQAEGGSVPSTIFYLKARAKWSDNNELDKKTDEMSNQIKELKETVQGWMKDRPL